MINQFKFNWALGAGLLVIVTAAGCARDDSQYGTSASTLDQAVTATTGPTDDGATSSPTPTATGNITVSGVASFDFVPATSTAGLNYAGTTSKPIRGAVVQAVSSADNTVLASGVTDASGNYSLSVANSTLIFVRVRARLLQTGTPSWDMKVVDNTRSQANYVMDSSPFTTGAIDIPDENLHAASGWGGANYTSPRLAAPFAILDVLYGNIQTLLASDNALAFPNLLVNWSVNNVPADGAISLGQITTTAYHPDDGGLYILGNQDVDTDEYDNHVIAHEWGHYLENRFARTDSIGGSHTLDGSADPRLAFSEGFANAFSGIATGDSVYNDSSGTGQSDTQVTFDLTHRPSGAVNGIYGEGSVQTVIYNLYTNPGSSSTASFTPIFAAMRSSYYKATTAFTSMFAFITAIKATAPASVARLNSLLATESITTGAVDSFDSTHTETNFAGLSGISYVYRGLTSVGASVCSRGDLGNYNSAFNRRFFYFDVSSTRDVTLKAVPSTSGSPVMSLYRSGTLLYTSTAPSAGQTVSILFKSLPPARYVGEVYDNLIVNDTSATYQCITMSVL